MVAVVKPQTAATLQLLRERPTGVTAIDALSTVGSFRLAARIAELKAAGYVIRAETIRTPTGKRIARYVLEEQLVVGL
jgi:hypothetical protein